MSNLRAINEIPVVESAENANVVINNNGTAAQIPMNKISVPQTNADWNETNEESPAFIMNKPTSLGTKIVSYWMTGTTLYRFAEDGTTSTDDTYKVSWGEFKEAFDTGIVRFCNGARSINDADSIGTIVGYYPYTGTYHLVTIPGFSNGTNGRDLWISNFTIT